MTTSVWQPGKLYLPGDLVQPAQGIPSIPTAIPNAGFEAGDVGWTKQPGWVITQGGAKYSGGWSAEYQGNQAGFGSIVLSAPVPVAPGTRINASVMVQQGASSRGNVGAHVALYWYKADGSWIRNVDGNVVNDGSGGAWHRSSVSDVAPADAGLVGIAAHANRVGENKPLWIDDFQWDYSTLSAPAGLIYRAVQANAGYSGNAEPAWPPVLGQTVQDNQVTWEAVQTSRVVWSASFLLKSGAVEPVWPTVPGGYVSDGTISWECISRRVEDPNCPNSKVVAIVASKVFAGDKDIVRFSATANPLDWTTKQDAGYLPTGLQQANANDVAVINQYRGNLVPMNASTFQNWQVDPDPSAMALLDQMDGIGSIYQRAAQPVGNELFFLSALGVRTVSIAAGSTNLAAGDVGVPVDPLVQAAMKQALIEGVTPIATYYPSAGQYWLAINRLNAAVSGGSECQVFVYTMSPAGQLKAWSRYVYPFAIDAFAQLGNDLYIRHGDTVSVVDPGLAYDEVNGAPVNFPGRVQWAWLDMGPAGVTKMLEGFDIVGEGTPSVSIGYDQRNPAAFTPPYPVSSDTVPGGIIPLPVSAPSMSVRVDYPGGEPWNLSSMTLYLHGNGGGP